MPQRNGKAWDVNLLVVLSWVEICQVLLSVSGGGPGLAIHIQLLFGGWREATATVTTWLLNRKVDLGVWAIEIYINITGMDLQPRTAQARGSFC